MVQPIDYMINAPSPVDRFGQGLLTGQQSRAQEMNMQLAQSQEARAQTEFDQAQQDRARALQDQEAQKIAALKMQGDLIGLGEKVASGQATFNDFAQFSILYPDVGAELKGVWDGLDERRRKSDAAGLFKAGSAIKTGRPDLAAQMLEEYAVAAENGGQKVDADMARATAALIKSNPDAGLANIGLLLHSLDPEGAKALFGEAKPDDRFKVVGDQLIDLTADGGPRPVDLGGANGPEWRDATPEEAKAHGAVSGQINTKTNKFEADKPPSGMRIESDGRGGFVFTEGASAAGTSGDVIDYDPRAVESVIASIDEIASDPALARITGPIEGGGGNDVEEFSAARRTWYGSDGLALIEKIGQLQSTTWLAARQMLKGGGAITDYESRKAEAAMARLSRVKSAEEFRAALSDLKDAIAAGRAKLEASGQGSQPQGAASGASQPQGQTVIDGYSIEEVP